MEVLRISHNLDNEEKVSSRSVQLYGGSLAISLPRKWADEMSVERGSNVSVFEQVDGTLLVVPQGLRLGRQRIVVEARPSPDSDYLIRSLISAYLAACTQILIRSSSEEDLTTTQKEEIKKYCPARLIGTRYTSKREPDGRTLIKVDVDIDYSDSATPIYKMLSEMSEDVIYLHQEAMRAVKSMDLEYAKKVFANDNWVDSKYWYILRALKAAEDDDTIMRNLGLTSGRERLGLRHCVKNLERISDHGAKIVALLLDIEKNGGKLQSFKEHTTDTESWKDIQSLSTRSISVLKESLRSLIQRNYKLANEIISKVRKEMDREARNMERNIREYFPEIDAQEESTLILMVESLRRTGDYARGIAEIVMNIGFWEKMVDPKTPEEKRDGEIYKIFSLPV